jgi:hypothetical protein
MGDIISNSVPMCFGIPVDGNKEPIIKEFQNRTFAVFSDESGCVVMIRPKEDVYKDPHIHIYYIPAINLVYRIVVGWKSLANNYHEYMMYYFGLQDKLKEEFEFVETTFDFIKEPVIFEGREWDAIKNEEIIINSIYKTNGGRVNLINLNQETICVYYTNSDNIKLNN